MTHNLCTVRRVAVSVDRRSVCRDMLFVYAGALLCYCPIEPSQRPSNPIAIHFAQHISLVKAMYKHTNATSQNINQSDRALELHTYTHDHTVSTSRGLL